MQNAEAVLAVLRERGRKGLPCEELYRQMFNKSLYLLELIQRLRKRRCELCEHGTTVAVHQVAGLASLGRQGPGQPAWAALMANKRRKTLIVCTDCHDHIHANPVTNTA